MCAVTIRPERSADRDSVHALNARAFEGPAEADLVDAIRERATPYVSLVAEDRGEVVGHILFSPVALPGHPDLRLMGLAPMAATPSRQRAGIGTALVRAGLEACRDLGTGAVVVLGHTDYYPRFGFEPADGFGLTCEYEVPADHFMALELEAGHLSRASGTVRYHAAFGEL